MPNSERILSTIKPLPSPRDEPVRSKPAFEVVSGSLDVERTSQVQSANRMRLALWTWAWLALAGVVTVAWAIALGWGAFEFIQWLFD